MSLTILLADFPNYPAREIRKLAKQIRYLLGLQSKEGRVIAAELEELHVLRAKREAQLNDDVRMVDTRTFHPGDEPPVRLKDGDVTRTASHIPGDTQVIERIRACPVSSAIGGIDLIEAQIRMETLPDGVLADLILVCKRAKGMVHGSSFSTDKQYIEVNPTRSKPTGPDTGHAS
jgi:hypothetical protein